MLRRFGCKQILAIEPTPDLAAHLNEIEGLRVRQCVVNGSGQPVQFRIDTGNSESSSIVTGQGEENCLMVQGVTLTDLIAEHQVVDLAKVDVEGAEIDIFRATPDETLKRVKQFTVEFHDFKRGSGVTKEDVLTTFGRMRKLGFKVFVNSFWTYGDVLFVNTAFVPIGKRNTISLAVSGRWWPGIRRVAARVIAGAR